MKWNEGTVGIAGCGGLGGHLVEQFLRLGVRNLVVCDGDVFEESNMDRQILCTPENLGKKKVEAARQRAALLAPETRMVVHDVFVNEDNGRALFRGCDVVMDALDSPKDRETLRKICRDLQVPLVHGAIGDWTVRVGVLTPGDLLPEGRIAPRAETRVLSFVPAVCAGLQAAEAWKILRGEESTLQGRIRCLDLKTGDQTDLFLDRETDGVC